MVAQSPPFAAQNAQHSAALFRLAAFSPWRDASGVVAAGDLAVTAQATPNMSVLVAAGRAWLKGTQVASVSGGAWSTQGAYYGYNDAPVSLTVAAADPTNPRIDAVVAYATDSFYSGASNTFVLGIVTGTPAASPAAPAVPSNGLLLGTLAVAANATSIASGNIANVAPLAALRAGATICTSSTRPVAPYVSDGQLIYETDTKAFGFYIASTSTWDMWDTVTQTYTPTLLAGGSSVGLGTGGTLAGVYRRMGRLCWAEIVLNFGTTPNGGTGQWTFSLPLTGAAREQTLSCKSLTTGGTSANWTGVTLVTLASPSVAQPCLPTSSGDCRIRFVQNSDPSTGSAGAVPGGTGTFPFGNSSNMVIEGVYELATG